MSGGPVTSQWRPVPLELQTDLPHGGRWTSLRGGSREWLWAHPDPGLQQDRRLVRPGAAFVDAGGVEECLPTVRGEPDHGDVWSRPWSGTAEDASVEVPPVGTLRRRVRSRTAVDVGYEVTGRPGTPFLHAVHALLELSPQAVLEVPQAGTVTVLDSEDAQRSWPAGLDRLGPDDGTALCVLLPGCTTATVVDGDEALRLDWSADRPDLCSLLLWRNLGGWPAEGPYRSVGVEPLVGRAADLSTAAPGQRAELDGAGVFGWRLRVTAFARAGGALDPDGLGSGRTS